MIPLQRHKLAFIFTSLSPKRCLKKVAVKLEKKVGDATVKAIGITNQRETTILWDKTTGLPLHNAIVWLDTRTVSTAAKYIKKTKSKTLNEFRDKVGMPIATYFSALKISWLIENVPDVKKAVAEGRCMFGTVDSWLIYVLTQCNHTT